LPPGPTYTDNIIGDEEDWKNEDNVRILRKRIEVLQQLAHENQLRASQKQKSYHDAHAWTHTFQPGDQVLRYRKSEAQRGVTSKLIYKWDGPYTIVSCNGTRYKLKNKKGELIPELVPGKELYKDPGDLLLTDTSVEEGEDVVNP